MRHSKLLAFLLCSTLVLGDSSGPTSGTAAGSGWTTVANVGASDNAYATYAIPASSPGVTCSPKAITLGCEPSDPTFGVSTALSISSLGFAVPASATITGITATFERKCSGTSSCNTGGSGYIKLSKTAGVAQGTSKGSTTSWGTTDATETLGGSTDLWGSTWTQSEVNATGFGMVVIVANSNSSTRTASIDYMALTVTYSPSGSGSHRRVIISQTRSINLSPQGT